MIKSLAGKQFKFKFFEIFCDNGNPKVTLVPKIVYPSWCGISVYWLGREFNIRKLK